MFIINNSQHGFRAKQSCLTQLLVYYDLLLQNIEARTNVDSIMLNLSKTFDKVDTGILCHSLKKMGISGKIGRWIH